MGKHTLSCERCERYISFTGCSSPDSAGSLEDRTRAAGTSPIHLHGWSLWCPAMTRLVAVALICYFTIALLSRVNNVNEHRHCTVHHCGSRYKTQLKLMSVLVTKKYRLQLFWPSQVLFIHTTSANTSGFFLKPTAVGRVWAASILCFCLRSPCSHVPLSLVPQWRNL